MPELRHALRSLAARPWFTVAAIASLAFGIGANATVFTIVNGVLFRPLPYPDADRLVFVQAENARLGVVRGAVTLAELTRIREGSGSLRGAGVAREGDFNVNDGERPRRVRGAIVSAATLATLGVGPAHGAIFAQVVDAPGIPRRVVVSDHLWRSSLGSGVSPVGRTIRIDGAPFEIIGVMPPAFGFPETADFWIPVGAAAAGGGEPPASSRAFQLVARLAPGASIEAARAELRTLARALDAERPATDRGWTFSVVAVEAERGENARAAVYLLYGLVTCVLLVACANLASLLIARAVSRRRELAIRSALGASHARLVWHGLAESVVIAVLGGALGLGLGVLGARIVRVAFPADTLPFWLRFEIDWRVIGYSLGLSAATTLAFGLVPALWSARRAPAAGLLSASRSATSGRARATFGGALIAGQVAVSLVLLVTASLLAVSLLAMRRADLGYEPAGLVTTDIEPRGARYAADDARRALYTALGTNVRGIPGVSGVTGFDVWGGAPVELATVGNAAVRRVDATLYAVMPTYFETMRIRLAAGRPISASDMVGAELVAVVNEAFVRRHWPDGNAIGRQVRVVSRKPGGAWVTIVGVSADVRRNPADLELEPHIYVSAVQFPPRRLRLVARTQLVLVTATALERAARSADPDEALGPLLTMDQQIAVWTAPARFFSLSLSGFAVVALLIAAAGLYGVVAGSVASRTREFGIRLALGATPRHVVRLAVGRGARLALLGAAVGLVGAVAVARVVVTLPFGVERADGRVVAGASLALVTIVLLAAYAPARRAARVEPVVALGDER